MLTILGKLDPEKIVRQGIERRQGVKLGRFSPLEPHLYDYYLCGIESLHHLLRLHFYRWDTRKEDQFYGPLPPVVALLAVSSGPYDHVRCLSMNLCKSNRFGKTTNIYQSFFPNTFINNPHTVYPYSLSNHPASMIFSSICGVAASHSHHDSLMVSLERGIECLLETAYHTGEEDFAFHSLFRPYLTSHTSRVSHRLRHEGAVSFFTRWESMTHEELYAQEWGPSCTLAELMDYCYMDSYNENENSRARC